MSCSTAILSPSYELDKISQLPDDILVKFLSILDFKNAVQTSILAKRWRYLWNWLTDLDLDPINMSLDNYEWDISKKIGPQGYLNWVNQIVGAHRGPFIRKFRVFFHSQWSKDISQVEKWAMFALSKRVEELDLNLKVDRPDSLGFPISFSLGFDMLMHPPCYKGIANLKSLRLSNVDISGETLQFILLQCYLLEQLYVFRSYTLLTLNIVSHKLKHLTLISCKYLKELEIDAVNLFSFFYVEQIYGLRRNLVSSLYKEENSGCFHTNIVFKSVPKLVELGFDGGICVYPFSILRKISCISEQLTKFSFCPNVIDVPMYFETLVETDVLFPNVKHITLTVFWLDSVAVEFTKFIIDACPMLHELKLQIFWTNSGLKDESKQPREIELENERIDEILMGQNLDFEAQNEKVVNYVEGEECENGHQNLKILEIVGFDWSDSDVKSALDIIAGATSIETLICDPRSFIAIGQRWDCEDVEKTNTIMTRARKFAKVLPPKVHLGLRDKSDLFWVS